MKKTQWNKKRSLRYELAMYFSQPVSPLSKLAFVFATVVSLDFFQSAEMR